MTSKIDELNEEKEQLQLVLDHTKRVNTAKREAQRKRCNLDEIEELRRKAEEERLASLTEEEKIEDEIITLKE